MTGSWKVWKDAETGKPVTDHLGQRIYFLSYEENGKLYMKVRFGEE